MSTCFYCREPVLSGGAEDDHAPIPARLGGTDTVVACLACHDLKDRVPLNNWPVDLMVQALDECGPLGRIFLAKSFGIAQDIEAERELALSSQTPASAAQPPAGRGG